MKIFIALILISTSAMAEAYKEIRDSNFILRMSDKANIPIDPDNRDYKEYEKWVKEGGKKLPADPLPPIVKTDLELMKEEIEKLKTDVQILKGK